MMTSPDRTPGSRTKRCFDLFVVSTLLTLLSPLFAVIALPIRCTSGSPVVFRQQVFASSMDISR